MSLLIEEALSPSAVIDRYQCSLPIDFRLNPVAQKLIVTAEEKPSSFTDAAIRALPKQGQYVPVGYFIFTDAKRRINKEACALVWSQFPQPAKAAVFSSLFLDYIKDSVVSGLSEASVKALLASTVFTSEQRSQLSRVLQESYGVNQQYGADVGRRYSPAVVDTIAKRYSPALDRFFATISSNQFDQLLSVLDKKEQKFAVAAIPESYKSAVFSSAPTSFWKQLETVLYDKAKHHIVARALPITRFDRSQVKALSDTLNVEPLQIQRGLTSLPREQAVALYHGMSGRKRISALKSYVAEQFAGEKKDGTPIQNSVVILCAHPKDATLFKQTYGNGADQTSFPEDPAVRDMLERLVTLKVYPHNRFRPCNPVSVTPGKQSQFILVYPSLKHGAIKPALQVSINFSDSEQQNQPIDPDTGKRKTGIKNSLGDHQHNRSHAISAPEDYTEQLHNVCHSLHLEHENGLFTPPTVQPFVHKPLSALHLHTLGARFPLLQIVLNIVLAPVYWAIEQVQQYGSRAQHEEKQQAATEPNKPPMDTSSAQPTIQQQRAPLTDPYKQRPTTTTPAVSSGALGPATKQLQQQRQVATVAER